MDEYDNIIIKEHRKFNPWDDDKSDIDIFNMIQNSLSYKITKLNIIFRSLIRNVFNSILGEK